jgi:formylglycine-generating enzyme required for sulfatase activity/serine/threonine protein kinase
MAAPSPADLVRQLAQGPLLSPERRQELPALQAAFPDARGLARELVKRGWLTPFQVNQLMQGRGGDLVMGPYVLLERLGEGGMGQVFKAHHTFLNRPVALKLIGREHLSSGSAAARFLQEMRLVAQLDHPNIVHAYDANQAGDRYYLVMELIAGETLAHLVQRQGPLPVGLACHCIREAALGLQHAHERGLVHRDIKPSNLMLTAPASRGRQPPEAPVVKVLDLGLARPQGSDSNRDLTRTGTVMGTLDYLAPEQALDPRGVDTRADIYSLGCTFYFLLAGRPPFYGGNETQKLLRHQQEEPPGIETLRPDVPAPVAEVLRRTLAKKPEQRYQTPAELAAALQPFASTDGYLGAAAPGGPTPDTSLISGKASAERGWTLMVDPSLNVAAVASTEMRPRGAGSQTAPAAPSLVTAPAAAPEAGWTLLTEPGSVAAAPATAMTLPPASASVLPVSQTRALEPSAAPTARPRLSGLAWVVIAGLALGAGLVAVGLVLLLRQPAADTASPPPEQDAPGTPNPSVAADRLLTNSIGMKLVLLPAGKFTMGSPPTEKGRGDDEDEHEVTIRRPFYIGAYEVAQDEYRKMMGTNPSYFAPTGGGKAQVAGLQTGAFPVEYVSWDDAVAFCKKLSELPAEKAAGRTYALPTEAEWEYACRAGAETPFSFGDKLATSQANIARAFGRTARVGSYAPNAFGLCDLHGNVWEWCADWYDAAYYRGSSAIDPPGPATGRERVLRGGAWATPAQSCRAAQRGRNDPATRNHVIGFRVVCRTAAAP